MRRFDEAIVLLEMGIRVHEQNAMYSDRPGMLGREGLRGRIGDLKAAIEELREADRESDRIRG